MTLMRATLGPLLIGALVLLFAAGCGDDDIDSADTNDGADSGQSITAEDCDDDEYFNPVTKECLEDEESDNNGEQDCDDGQVFDSELDECVPECRVDEIYNPETGECEDEPTVNDPEDNCSEGYEWDPHTEECVEQAECGPGEILGQTCRPDGGIMPGAEISIEGVDCDGYAYQESTTADSNGYYDFSDVPSGQHEITITSGSFELVDDVVVGKDQTTDLTSDSAKLCLEGSEVNIAVINGSFDDIEELLDGMQIQYDTIGNVSNFLGDLDSMRDYDIIFAECGASVPGGAGSDAASNIRRFVEEGHSLYSSDWARDFVEDTIPEAGTFHDDTGSSKTITVDVLNSDMQALLGGTTAEVVFNLGGWYMMETPGPSTEVYFQGDVSMMDDAPLMVLYDDPIGQGRAIFTSFHNSSQATDDIHDILEYMIFQL